MRTPSAERVRLHKAISLALDPAATEGEQKAAMLGVLRIARTRGWNLSRFLSALVESREDNFPWGWDVVFPFGKFKGQTVGEIASHSPDYLAWSIANMSRLSKELDAAIRSVLDWIHMCRR